MCKVLAVYMPETFLTGQSCDKSNAKGARKLLDGYSFNHWLIDSTDYLMKIDTIIKHLMKYISNRQIGTNKTTCINSMQMVSQQSQSMREVVNLDLCKTFKSSLLKWNQLLVVLVNQYKSHDRKFCSHHSKTNFDEQCNDCKISKRGTWSTGCTTVQFLIRKTDQYPRDTS